MARDKRPKNKAPAKSRKLSVLSFLYGVLILGLAGLAGYAYFLQTSTPEDGRITATVSISKTVPGKHDDADHSPAPAKEEKPQPEKTTEPAIKDVPAVAVSEDDKQATEVAETKTSEEEKPEPTPTEESSTAEVAKPPVTEEVETPTKNEPAPEEKKAAVTEPETNPKAEPKPAQKKEEVKPAQAPPAAAKEEAPKQPDPKHEVKPEPKVTAESPKPVGPLPPVPDPALAAKSDFGLLPIVSPDGRKPWRVYARPFDDPLSRPRIAIIIGDMGMSKFATRSAIQDLPGEVTLSFNPYGRDLQNWVAQARAAGHEALLQLPMEPFGYPENDPGPQSLLSRLTDKENLNRLEWMLGRFTGYSGVTNQMGSRFTTSSEDISPIMDVIRDRGLLFVDGRTSGRSVAGYVAKQKAVPVAINNRFISNRADRASIDQRLAELERIARITGVAIGVGFPYPVTLERLAVWSKSLTRKGLVLAPVSAIVNKQEIQ